MLRIEVPPCDLWDEVNEKFLYFKGQTLQLEHSLVSISKWESKWHRAFLSDREKTQEEVIDYIRCMTITQNVKPIVYSLLTSKNFEEIDEYINDSMTATYFLEEESGKSRDVITSELIYYWMIAQNIPVEFEKWHLNRLLALIKVCNMKNSPKKMSKKEIMRRNSAINAARKKKYNTKG